MGNIGFIDFQQSTILEKRINLESRIRIPGTANV